MAELRCIGGPRDGEVIDVRDWRGRDVNLPTHGMGYVVYRRTDLGGVTALVYADLSNTAAVALMLERWGPRTDKLPVQ